MNTESFVIERTLKASVEKIWKSIINKDRMEHWYFETIDIGLLFLTLYY